MGLEMEMFMKARIEDAVRCAWVHKKLERTQFLSSEICLFDYFWALRMMQTVLTDIVASN